MDAKPEKFIVIGCSENEQYKVWLADRNVAVISRDVTISENRFPGGDLDHEWNEPGLELIKDADTRQSGNSSTPVRDRHAGGNSTAVQPVHLGTYHDENEVQMTPAQQQQLTYHPPSVEGGIVEEGQETHPTTTGHTNVEGTEEDADRSEEPRHPRREHQPPSYDTAGSSCIGRAFAMMERKPNPSTVQEASSQKDAAEWRTAIHSELKSIRQHGTWDIVVHPQGAKPLSTRFVFIRKFDENGLVIRHKAHLVVQGTFFRWMSLQSRVGLDTALC